jgi:hypothetical protein
MDRQTSWLARAGAISYAIWALLHFEAAATVYRLGAGLAPSMVQARVLQDAWNLACFALAALAVAITLNWRNSALGFWLNLGIVSAADIGFVLFVLAPGHLGWWPGVLGPVFWLGGAALSALALWNSVNQV